MRLDLTEKELERVVLPVDASDINTHWYSDNLESTLNTDACKIINIQRKMSYGLK